MILLERLKVDRFKGLRDVDLVLPKRGSVLVEGLNEAGKSTLFESVYFALYGSLLASEDNRGSLESAIGYGASEATVELAFRVAETRLLVTRAVHVSTSSGQKREAKRMRKRRSELSPNQSVSSRAQ